MTRKDWEALKATLEFENSAHWWNSDITPETQPRLRAARVKDKGAIVTLISLNGADGGKIRFEDGRTDRIGHEKLDLLDANGNVIEIDPRDMLGEPLQAGAWVTYPFGYRDDHSMGIGRVIEIKSGILKVQAKVENSEPVEVEGRTGRTLNVRSEKCVKLPVDVPRMMMAILTNFQSIDGSKD